MAPQLKRLARLRVCSAARWEEAEERAVEAWCEGRGVALVAGWRMRTVVGRWW